jgi:parallel beta-helix repeat protein
MSKRLSLILTLIIVLIGMLDGTFRFQMVNASGIIYIRANGMIEPKEAPISSFDNITYTLTGNINDLIVVERDSILVDGAGYTVQGTGKGKGISLDGRRNVTIQNVEIIAFNNGIYLCRSSNNRICRNRVTANTYIGISLSKSSNNSIVENNITASNCYGIYVDDSLNNNITENVFTKVGLFVADSYGNLVEGNVVNGKPLVYLEKVSDYAVADAGQVVLVNCDNVSVENLSLTETTLGLELWKTKNCEIASNSITNNWYGIRLIESLNNSIVENSIMASNQWGIWLDSSSNNSVIRNHIANHYTGIWFSSSSNNKIIGNNVTENKHWGIVFQKSLNNSIRQNNITTNKDDEGISLYGYSNHNSISENCITGNYFNGVSLLTSSNNSIVGNNLTANNYDGIRLDLCSNYNNISGNYIATNKNDGIDVFNSSNNSIDGNKIVANKLCGVKLSSSSNNSIVENEIKSNYCGASFINSSKNKFYHNNFSNNTQQAWTNSINVWDDGYPSGGNYWSDYTGIDSDYDGIGNTEYVLGSNNTDHYPLMGMFHSFNMSLGYAVDIISNSTIEDFQYFDHNKTIIMHVSNLTINQTFGFCRLRIPHVLINETYRVTINGAEPYYWNYALFDDGDNRWVYFSYQHSTLEIIIVPEFPSFLILPLFMIATLLLVKVRKRKHTLVSDRR